MRWVFVHHQGFVQRDAPRLAAMFDRCLAARLIDQDAAHRLRRRCEKVRPAIPRLAAILRADPTQISLVH